MGICGQRRARYACASAQSNQGLPNPLAESLNTTECINDDTLILCTCAGLSESAQLAFEGMVFHDAPH